ncbi:MAG: hypothetical protein ACTSRS_11440 [Candidatus Helarchaeota archaeon]
MSESIEFALLCSIQLFTMAFSSVIISRSYRHYRRTNPSEILLRKSIKYFTFIFVTINFGGIFSIISNFYFLITKDGVGAGYIYAIVSCLILLNVYCGWQFLTYLLHPKRQPTKYFIGIYCILGIIFIWIFTPTVSNVLTTPNLKNDALYIYLWAIFAFVWAVFVYEFLKRSLQATERRDKYRFCCLGLSGIFAFFMFPMGILGTLFSWLFILLGTLFLYLGYYFPKFFQKLLNID